MANTLRIKRRAAGGAAGAPTPLEAGELAVNFSDNKLYIGDGTTAVAIAGKGEFVDLGSIQTITGKKTFSGGINMNDKQLENLLDPRSGNDGLKDATNRGYVDSAIATAVAALGSVFEYVGNVSLLTDPENTGAQGATFNLDTLAKKSPGDYYRVDVAGTYTAAGQTLKAKVGDAFVRTATDWQRLDNVDAEVTGTANEISVTGDENAGYTVGLASGAGTFKTNIEAKTQNILLPQTTAGATAIKGHVSVGSYSSAGALEEDTKITPNTISLGGWEYSSYGAGFGVGIGKSNEKGAFISVETGADTTFRADSAGIILGSQGGATVTPSLQNIQCRHNLLGVDDPLTANPTKMKIDNFVIDGGVF
jgi:hypothetical protein